jgi:hypothetical protein
LRRARTVASIASLIAAALIFVASESAAVGRGGDTDGGSLQEIASKLFPGLTRAERAMLWFCDVDNVNRGEIAVAGPSANPDDPSNDPSHADKWDPQRQIRAPLIRWMCFNPDAIRRIDPQGIGVLGARIVGGLNLSYIHVPYPLVFRSCAFTELIKLNSAEVPQLDLDGSYTGRIFADQIRVTGPLRMDRGFRASEEVYLSQARVDGWANFAGGHFMHSKVEPVWGKEFKMALVLDHAQLRGPLLLCCGFESNGAVMLWNSSIGGDLVFVGGRFINPDNAAIVADETEIAGDVGLGEYNPTTHGKFESNGAVQFEGARIGGTFAVNGARFLGARTERHGLFAGGMTVKRGLFWRSVLLENNAILDLSAAQAELLGDEEKSWPKPGKLFIDGFKYDGFVLDSPSDVTTRLRWIGLNDNPNSPQPYDQLAKFYRSTGAMSAVAEVLMARDDAIFRDLGPFQAIWGAVAKVTIGYGHRPMLTVFWMLGVVAIGWMMVSIGARAGLLRPTWPENPPATEKTIYPRLHPFLYSLDVFLPFVNLHQERYWWPDGDASGDCVIFGRKLGVRGSVVQYYLWLQIMSGWLLSAIFVAGVTGLIRSD